MFIFFLPDRPTHLHEREGDGKRNILLGWPNLFSQSATLPVYLFVSVFVNLHFLPYYFLALSTIQDFSLNFARTLGRAVDKLLNSSRVNSHGQFIFGKQSLSLRLK